MYNEDSFYTLSQLEQIGLLALSILLSGILIWTALVLTKEKSIVLKVTISLVLFYLFVCLSPQVYYTYYLFIFNDLPMQIVIKTPPSPLEVGKLMLFQSKATLSAHSKGFLGIIMIVLSIAPALGLPKQKTKEN